MTRTKSLVVAVAVCAAMGSVAAAEPTALTEDQVYLFQVCEVGDTAEAQRLLDAGVDPLCRDAAGFTPLILAGQAAEPDLIRLLLAAGCDPAAANAEGINPLLAVVHSCGQLGPQEPEERQPFITSVQLLIAAGAPFDAVDGEGRGALAIARHYGDDTLVPYLTPPAAQKD